jgi:hypothetical protein
MVDGIAAALLALVVVGAGAVGAILWLIAGAAPERAEGLFGVSLLVTVVTIPFGIIVFIETVLGDWVAPLSPIFTVGVPGACILLALATWGIWRISRRSAD